MGKGRAGVTSQVSLFLLCNLLQALLMLTEWAPVLILLHISPSIGNNAACMHALVCLADCCWCCT